LCCVATSCAALQQVARVLFVEIVDYQIAQRVANIRAARDAELRDAKALAEQIKTRLIADLSKTE
jgi:hypothetical protein